MLLKVMVIRDELLLRRAQAYLANHWRELARRGMPMVMQVVPWAAKRTAAQNRRYWGVIIEQIAEQAWVDGRMWEPEQWHEYFKRKLIGVMELPGGESVGMSSAALSVAGFNDYTDKVEQYAIEMLGCEFDYDRLPAAPLAIAA
jgi:hypothetical protein